MVKDVKAVLLIKVRPTREKIVGDALKSYDQVLDCWVTFGEFDVVAIIEGDDQRKIAEFVTKTVRQIDGVNKTATLLAID